MVIKKFIKVISVLVTLCIAFACCVLTVSAVKEKNIEYTIDNKRAVIEKIDATGLSQLEIPAKLGGYDVVYLSENAIVNAESVVSISIPASVEDLGEFDGTPFQNMNNLEKIIVDANNKYYSSDESGVLYDKNKTTLIQYPASNKNTSYSAPDSVSYIKSYAFTNCKYLVNVESLGKAEQLCETFVNCKNLKKVNIPENVTLVNEHNSLLFYGCDSLTDIYFGGSRAQWKNLEIRPDNPFVKKAVIHFASDEEVTASSANTTKVKTTAKKTTERITETDVTLMAETESLTGETEITEKERETTEKADVSVSNEKTEQLKTENNMLKYIIPVVVVLLVAVSIFLVKKYKQ